MGETRTGIFYSEWTGHNRQTVAIKEANVNSKDLTLRGFDCYMLPPYYAYILLFLPRFPGRVPYTAILYLGSLWESGREVGLSPFCEQ